VGRKEKGPPAEDGEVEKNVNGGGEERRWRMKARGD